MAKIINCRTSALKILNALSDSNHVVEINNGGLISINKRNEAECFMLHEGCVLVRRTEDDLIISKLISPIVFGFNKYYDLTGKVYLEAVNDVVFEVIPASHFYKKIAQHDLWESLLDIMMFISSEIFHKTNLLAMRDSWSITRLQLIELLSEPDVIRTKISAYDYVQQRTHLSRSGILKHLSKLRNENLIELENGILISISNLPKSLT